MEPLILALGWVGLYAPLALGAIGSMVGCARAGSAACGALLEVESGYGRYVGVAAMPSSICWRGGNAILPDYLRYRCDDGATP